MALLLPGLLYPHSYTAVELRGPSPSRILGLAAYQPVVSSGYGDILASVAGNSLTMRDCASVSYHLRQNMRRHGEPVLSVAFEDRRWKWRYASVSGIFNERLPDCSIRYSATHPKFRRSARELFGFLLTACGDPNADLSAAPASVYPECRWHDTPCDEALAWLCARTYCSIVLNHETNQVSVVQRGIGQNLPDLPNMTHISTTVRIGAIPDAIAIGCGPTRVQSKLELEPVGLDLDNRIRKIDDLTYKPDGGWLRSWPGEFTEVAFGKARSLAARTVWRWYRVKQQANGGLTIPGFQTQIDSPAQYRLTNWLVDTGRDPDNMPTPVPAFIQGRYYPQHDYQGNSLTRHYNPAPFTILPDLNLVEFAYPVWYANDGYEKPSLYLTTSYYVLDRNGEGLVHYLPRRQLGHDPVGTKDFVLRRPELWQTHVVRYQNDDLQLGSTENNLFLITSETDQYLDYAATAITGLSATDKAYFGIASSSLDGRRQSKVVEYAHDVLPNSRFGEMSEHDIFTDDEHQRRQ